MTNVKITVNLSNFFPDYEQNLLSSNYYEPYKNFLTRNNTKILAQIGGTALLPCTVRLSSNPATVSWLKRRHHQLLTVGLFTHISDERFMVEHVRHMGHWALKIKTVQASDKGLYECQLSVHPVESIFVELNVVGKLLKTHLKFSRNLKEKNNKKNDFPSSFFFISLLFLFQENLSYLQIRKV